MLVQTIARHVVAVARGRGHTLFILGVGLFFGVAPLVEDAAAQRPFHINDPFYRNESARRTFFDGYAVSGEISYRPLDSRQTVEREPLGLSFRIDYELLDEIDLGVIVDASSRINRSRLRSDSVRSAVFSREGGRSLSVSWLVLKYYRTVENSNYAFRLAVDPAPDGRTGFPQMDLAFISTSTLSPMLVSDFAIGIRRVQMGYEQWIPSEEGEGGAGEGPLVVVQRPTFDVLYTRALGLELHGMLSYDMLFDPAGSNLFVSLLGEAGQYTMVESSLRQFPAILNPQSASAGGEEQEQRTQDYRGGVVWFRAGMELDRPNYQLSPFLSVPIKQWAPVGRDWPEARIHVGARLTLR